MQERKYLLQKGCGSERKKNKNKIPPSHFEEGREKGVCGG